MIIVVTVLVSEFYKPSWLRRTASRCAATAGLRYYDFLYCERSLQEAVPSPTPKIPLDVRVADGNDIEAMLALRHGDERRVVEGIAQRGVGYVAESDQGIIGYAWSRTGAMHLFCRRPLEYVELAPLPDDVCYTNNSYVVPEHRGQGVFQALLACQYRDRAARGFATVTNLIESVNLDSLAAHRHMRHRTQRARVVRLPLRGPKLTYLEAGPSWLAAA